jgi:LysM repeat protein
MLGASFGTDPLCTASAPGRLPSLVSANFTGRTLLGYPAHARPTARRLLPFAVAPAAAAGLAAAFAFGNAPSATSATADVALKPPTVPAAETAQASSAQLLAFTHRSASALPVVRLNAGRAAAIKTTGKHHRALPAKYTVKSGDTLASIAQHLYHSADYWTVLYYANHAAVQYANEIQVGQELTVPAKPAKAPSAPAQLSSAPAPAPVAATATTSVSATPSYSSASSASSSTASTATVTTTSGGSSFQACVIARESGGNAQIFNGSGHYGLYQFSASTWAAYGGNPADFGHASVAEQNAVFDAAIAAGGESNWAPYDGC